VKPWFLSLFCVLPLAGQMQQYYNFRLDNGAQVGYQIWSGVESRPGQKSLSMAESSGNVIRRTLYNQDGTPWLGFEVHIDITDNSDFRISFAPAAGFPFFAGAPLPRRVHDGDRIMMDVLEQPGTSKKVFDLFQLYRKDTRHTLLPLPMDSIPSVLPVGTELRLNHPSFRLGGVHLPSTQDATMISGPVITLEVPTLGRFRLSSAPLPGYLLEAVAEDGKIEVAGDDRYTVTSETAVVDKPGSWFVWVKFEPASVATPSPPNMPGPPPLEVTATPTLAGEDGTFPGFVLSIKNTSAKNVVAYSIQMHYTDPITGQSMGSSGHNSFRQPMDGKPNYLQPGQVDTSPKATSFPRDASGAAPKYTITVELVLFDDGSLWGTATSRGAQQLLKQAKAAGLVK